MASSLDQVWKMMEKLDFCMFVTQAPSGLRSRPMSSVVKKDEGRIYFLTEASSAKDDEIAASPNVLLCYGDGASQFVSTAGTAAVSNDRALIEQLWNPGAQAFWPNGPKDPNVIAIVVRPASAEYWDGHGTVVSSVKFAVALLTGTSPDMGSNHKVAL